LLSTRPGEIDEILSEERSVILTLAAIALFTSIVTSLLLARTVADPMRRLSEAAEQASHNIAARSELPEYADRADEVGQMASAFRAMTKALYRRIEASEKFAADVAHELKNPLTAARCIAESLSLAKNEDERRHLARELHDDLSQRLARLAIDASYVSSNLGSDAANDVMKNIHPELVSISKDVHDMSYRLHPSLVEDLGIVAALRTECQRIRRQSDAEILEKYDEISQGIPTDTALNIYRIAQEALHNAVKCSRADTIGIVIECKQQLVSLEVNDDGIGFDVRSELAGGGLGLSSMRERALLIGGVLNINSQPGAGTSVSVSVPLQGNAE